MYIFICLKTIQKRIGKLEIFSRLMLERLLWVFCFLFLSAHFSSIEEKMIEFVICREAQKNEFSS
jgi:uncharacterized membrane protein